MANLDVYFFVIGLVSAFIIAFIALTYLISKVFRIGDLEAYVNIELSEFFASFFIILFAIAFFETANVIAVSIAGGGDSAVSAATNSLKVYMGYTFSGIRDVFHLQVCVSVLSTFTRRIGEFVLTLTYKLFPGLDSYLGILNIIGFGLTAVFGSLNAQLILMQLIDATMIKFFLPAGIILRFFPPTRDAGLFLIAFSIGFQAIFRTTFVINQKILEIMEFEQYDVSTLQLYTACQPASYLIFGIAGNPQLGLISTVFGKTFNDAFNLVFSELGINILTPVMFSPFLHQLAKLSLPALFLPAFSLTITIAFINSFVQFLSRKM